MAEDKQEKSGAGGKVLLTLAVALIGAAGGFLGALLQSQLDNRKQDLEEMAFAFDIIREGGGEKSLLYQEWACSILAARTPEGTTLDCTEAAREVYEVSTGTIPGDPDKTYVSLFYCRDGMLGEQPNAELAALYERTKTALIGADLGNIRRKGVWDDAAVGEFYGPYARPSITIVADQGHGEWQDAERLAGILSPRPVIKANQGAEASPWSLTVIVCDG